MFQYEFLKFVEIACQTMDHIIAFAFWNFWVRDDLMSLHPRFILSAIVLVLGVEHVSIN